MTRIEWAAGRVLVAASHAAPYSGFLAAKAGVRGLILNDAGVGRDGAGIAGLDYLQALGMPAAAIDYRTARIGDGADTLSRGTISHANRAATALGVTPGMAAAEAALRLTAAPDARYEPPPLDEARHLLRGGPVEVWAIDSNSLARPADAGQVLITGSHGGLLGGNPASALKVDALAAVYNDAGVGRDQAGISRLPHLDARGIAALTVAVASARLGDARSTWLDGIVSHANATAARLGVVAGLSVPAAIDRILGRTGA